MTTPTAQDWAILARHGVTPDNLSVGGNLDLDGGTFSAITALPNNLSIGGSLYLRGTAIRALPENLSIGRWLYISRTAIKALPENLSIGGGMDLSFTAIKALPDSISVGAHLVLYGTAIAALYRDARGYRLDRAGNRYIAGCRNFTAAEALAHWGSDDYPDRERGAAYVAAIKAEEARRQK